MGKWITREIIVRNEAANTKTMQRNNEAKDATNTEPSILLQFEAHWFRAAQCTQTYMSSGENNATK